MTDHSAGTISDAPSTAAALFRSGFLAMLPLWAGAIPFGIAYSIAAREAGLQVVLVQLMSLTMFSAAGQISAVSLLQAGASTLEILVTAGALNVHLLLIGAAVARELRLSLMPRVGTAALLTDASYAVALSQGQLRAATLAGAGVSMYLGWNLGTVIGLLAGQVISDFRQLALDFVVPLTFLAVLTPMLRSRPALAVASGAAGGTLLLANWLPLGFAIFIAGATASLLGARLTTPQASPEPEVGGQ